MKTIHSQPRFRRGGALCVVLVLLAAGGCDLKKHDMYIQPKRKPEQVSSFFANGMSARPLVPGTIARRDLGGAYYYKSAQAGQPEVRIAGVEPAGASGATESANPAQTGFPADFPTGGEALSAKLARGEERFLIFCSPCHGLSGQGNGMVVHRGLTAPPSFIPLDEDRLRQPHRYERELILQSAPPVHIYNVITNGFGAMFSYAERVKPEDRWAIAAYIKALQAAAPAATPQGPAATIPLNQTRSTGK